MNVTMGVKGGERISLTQAEAIIMEKVKLDPKLGRIAGLLPLGILVGTIPHHAFAAPEAVPVIGGAIKDKIIHLFDPLINLIQALAFPIQSCCRQALASFRCPHSWKRLCLTLKILRQACQGL